MFILKETATVHLDLINSVIACEEDLCWVQDCAGPKGGSRVTFHSQVRLQVVFLPYAALPCPLRPPYTRAHTSARYGELSPLAKW